LKEGSALFKNYENYFPLPQFHKSLIVYEHNDVKQLNPGCEVLQFPEYAAVTNHRTEYVSLVPIPAQKNKEVFALIGDGKYTLRSFTIYLGRY
jgi:hypothetical protein